MVGIEEGKAEGKDVGSVVGKEEGVAVGKLVVVE